MVAGRTSGTRSREIDDAVVLLVARLRVVVLTVAALAAAIAFGGGRRGGVQYTLTFFAIPASVALALAADRLPPRVSAVLGAAIDTVVFAASVIEFPDLVGTLGAALLVPVLLASYTGGRLLGAVTGFVGLALIGVADAAGWVAPSGDIVLLLAIAIAISLAVLGRADARLHRSTSRARYHEARASLILERLAEAIVVTGPAGRVEHCNAAAKELLAIPVGATTCDAVLDLRVDGRPLDCSTGCGLLAHEGSRESGGVEATACSGRARTVPVMVSVAEVVGAGGETEEHLHTLRDITKLKLADEAKTLFLATATHELKTPLTVIAGFLDTIAQPTIDADLRASALAVMRRRVVELREVIDRILLASRIESGHLDLDLGPVDAEQVARDRVTALTIATGRAIALRADEPLPLLIGDDVSLATVLDHLLDNACKYSAPSTTVEVTITHDETDVAIVVRDEGEGMTAEQVAHCFDRFWQADPTSRRKAGGTGIGLYIVRSLVRSMEGSVDVESTPGAGTTFTIRLRRSDSPSPREAPRPVGSVTPEPSIVREFMRQIGVETRENP